MKRVSALLLTLLLLISMIPWAGAAGTQSDAMAFAQKYLLAQSELHPTTPSTRGELAAMIVRLLGLQQKADLSKYTDVTPSTLYYESLSKAMSIGLLDSSGGKLNPGGYLTRERAVVLLARCFGVPDGDQSLLNSYADNTKISDWAAGPMAGMVAAGYVTATNNQLNPQSNITQQELVQLIYRLAENLVTDGALPQSGSAVLRTWNCTISDRTINGNLYLSGAFNHVELSNVKITGQLVVYTGSVTLSGTSTANEIVCVGPNVQVNQTGTIPVRVNAGNAVLSGGGDVVASGAVTLQSGSFNRIDLLGATATVGSGVQVQYARLLETGSRLTGGGSVGLAAVYASGCSVETATTQTQHFTEPGLGNAKLTAVTPANDATPTSPLITTTIQLNQLGITDAAVGTTWEREGTLSWYVDGVLVKEYRQFLLYEGVQATFQTTASYTGAPTPSTTIEARVTCGGQTVKLSQTVDKHIEKMSTPVRTMEIEATLRRTTTLYSSYRLTGAIRTVSAGTKVTYLTYATDQARQIRLSNGQTGWVGWNDLNISTKNYTRYTDYTQSEKENYVNIKGYSSTSKYLVWVSRLTQKVNIFEGSQRQWKLIHAFTCATGANTTPTVPGVFRYQYRMNKWDFDTYYVSRPMIFNGGHAFHTRTYRTNGTLLDPTIGRPVSHGCIRMYDQDVNWMWNNLPFGTTVVVY